MTYETIGDAVTMQGSAEATLLVAYPSGASSHLPRRAHVIAGICYNIGCELTRKAVKR